MTAGNGVPRKLDRASHEIELVCHFASRAGAQAGKGLPRVSGSSGAQMNPST